MAAASGDGVGNWIVSGGIGVDNSPLQTVKVFKENLNWVSGPNMPNALRFHCQVFFGTRVFIIGGFGTSGSTSSTLELEDGEWREDRSPMQTARSHHSCIPFARKIYSLHTTMFISRCIDVDLFHWLIPYQTPVKN